MPWTRKNDDLVEALREVLVSTNEADSNFEQANTVDGHFFARRAIGHRLTEVADALMEVSRQLGRSADALE
jgi:hypothetical protein